jgi:hypothetical protein
MTIEVGWAATSAILDGEAEFGRYGYDAITDDRVLHVPHGKAGDAAQAILICRRDGLLRSKLDSMSAEDAHYVYMTTLATATPEN